MELIKRFKAWHKEWKNKQVMLARSLVNDLPDKYFTEDDREYLQSLIDRYDG